MKKEIIDKAAWMVALFMFGAIFTHASVWIILGAEGTIHDALTLFFTSTFAGISTFLGIQKLLRLVNLGVERGGLA